MKRRSEGFTLVEVLAAIALLAFALTALLLARGRAVAMAWETRSVRIISRLAQTKMDEVEGGLMMDVFDGEDGTFGDLGDEYDGIVWRIGLGEDTEVGEQQQNNQDPDRPVFRLYRTDLEEEQDEDEWDPTTRVVIEITAPPLHKGGEPLVFVLDRVVATSLLKDPPEEEAEQEEADGSR